MPGRDGTGPMGAGPFTGRGLGPCGQGRGFGRYGRCFWRFPPRTLELSKEEKIKLLKAEKEDIDQELQELEKE